MGIKHSLVVPCFNDEGNVETFLGAVKEAMKGYTDSYEIVFVNDGSRDNTIRVLKRLFAENSDVRIQVISFSRNFGKESAMYAGLQAAKGDYVTVIDADMQQDPSVAVQMGRLLDENPETDMIAAFQAKRKESKLLEWCKTCFYKLINRMTTVRFIPDASDFRTLRRPVVDAILSLSEYHRFSKGLFSWVGYETMSIPYEVHDRQAGETNWNFIKLFRYAIEGIMAYTDSPLKWPLYAGAFLSVGGIALAIVLWILSLCGVWVGVIGYLIALMLLLTGILAVGQGIIGMYLGKVHTQVKQRPIYLVKEKLSYEELDH